MTAAVSAAIQLPTPTGRTQSEADRQRSSAQGRRRYHFVEGRSKQLPERCTWRGEASIRRGGIVEIEHLIGTAAQDQVKHIERGRVRVTAGQAYHGLNDGECVGVGHAGQSIASAQPSVS
jgi:hypothetical protein